VWSVDKIYHYCDLNGFLSIIENKKLWLSAANNLNDSKEVDYFLDKFHNKLCDNFTDDNREFLQFFWSLTSSTAPVPYICSFSKNGDLLSQWRAYADDGHGIAIGFNRDYLDSVFDLPLENNSSPRFLMSPERAITDVCYLEDEQNIVVDFIIDGLLGLPKDIKTDKSKMIMSMAAYSDLVNRHSYACKNAAFIEEDEVRVICNPMITGNDKGETTIFNGISPLNYRVTGKTITSYFEFDFSSLESHKPIIDLVLGPKCQLSRFDLEMFLSINGLGSIPFKLSKATYR
jgi:hypothetical protein